MNPGAASLWVWGPAFLGAAWLPPRRWQGPAMALAGLAYLGAADPRSLAWMLVLGLGGALWMRAAAPSPRAAGAWAAVVVAVLLAQRLLRAAPGPGLAAGLGPGSVAAVFGLSFYALRILHLLALWGRGSLPRLRLRDHLAYLAFLPILRLGPVQPVGPFLRDLGRRRWDAAMAAEGLERILHGLAKDRLLGRWAVEGHLLPWAAAAGLSPWKAAYLRCLLSLLSTYFRFAGACDVAIGLGRLAGFRLAENFDRPLAARNLSDFWRRWHMTLSAWCRDHVYTPVMARTRSTTAGILAGMAVLGLWHELSPRYLAWGLWNGLGIAVWHRYQGLKDRLPAGTGGRVGELLARALTLHAVILGCALTDAADLASGWRTLRLLLGLGGT